MFLSNILGKTLFIDLLAFLGKNFVSLYSALALENSLFFFHFSPSTQERRSPTSPPCRGCLWTCSRERLFGLPSPLRSLNLQRSHLGSVDPFPADLSPLATAARPGPEQERRPAPVRPPQPVAQPTTRAWSAARAPLGRREARSAVCKRTNYLNCEFEVERPMIIAVVFFVPVSSGRLRLL